MLLAADITADAASLRPTLHRVFEVGHPLALQSELAGRAVADGHATVIARLVDARGATVREGRSLIEPGAKKDRARATAVVLTQGLSSGAYALVWEARADRRHEVVRHAVPVTLRSADEAGAPASQR